MLPTLEVCVSTVPEDPIPISNIPLNHTRVMSQRGMCSRYWMYDFPLISSMRAIRCRYDPYIQTRTRVDQLKRLGHSVDKVEFVVMGGTFLSLEQSYQDEFIMKLHDALSGHHSHSVEEAVK